MDETWAPPSPPKPARGRGRLVFWVITGIAAACLIGPLIAAGVTTRIYSDTSTSMQPAIGVGDRLPVTLGAGIRRGDIVVLRIPSQGLGGDDMFVKRLIGLPGDRRHHVLVQDAADLCQQRPGTVRQPHAALRLADSAQRRRSRHLDRPAHPRCHPHDHAAPAG